MHLTKSRRRGEVEGEFKEDIQEDGSEGDEEKNGRPIQKQKRPQRTRLKKERYDRLADELTRLKECTN